MVLFVFAGLHHVHFASAKQRKSTQNHDPIMAKRCRSHQLYGPDILGWYWMAGPFVSQTTCSTVRHWIVGVTVLGHTSKFKSTWEKRRNNETRIGESDGVKGWTDNYNRRLSYFFPEGCCGWRDFRSLQPGRCLCIREVVVLGTLTVPPYLILSMRWRQEKQDVFGWFFMVKPVQAHCV